MKKDRNNSKTENEDSGNKIPWYEWVLGIGATIYMFYSYFIESNVGWELIAFVITVFAIIGVMEVWRNFNREDD